MRHSTALVGCSGARGGATEELAFRYAHGPRWCFLAVVFVACGVFLGCIDTASPFDDDAHARAVFVEAGTSFSDGDTAVPLYATRMVPVVVLVSEQVDSFSLHADSNRYFTDTTISAPGSREYSFPVSFFDTGWLNLSLVTYRSGGGEVMETWHCRIMSPLEQDSIVAPLDAPVMLRTQRVQDTAVWYHWKLGDGIRTSLDTISSEVWETYASLHTVGTMPGEVWVSADREGKRFASPAAPFWVLLDDRAGPEVLCLNGPVNDTIRTPEETFVFMALVVDAGGVEGVRIDGEPVFAVAGSSYRRIYSELDTLADRKRTISVRAWDRSGNETVRTYCLVYDTSAIPTQSTHIVVRSMREEATTSRSRIGLFGRVWEPVRSSVFLTASVNGVPSGDTQNVEIDTVSLRGEFYLTVTLTLADNTVELKALDSAYAELADTTVRILHRSNFVDKVPPRIVEVLCDGQIVLPGVVTYVPDTAAIVRVTAFDESGIASVRLNGQSMTPVEGKPYRWEWSVSPVAYGSPQDIDVKVTDSLGNTEVYRFLLQQNRPPSLASGWQWPSRLFVDSSYAIEFDVIDHDGDANVTVALGNQPHEMTVSRASSSGRWVIRWSPNAADTGSYAVSVAMSDSLQTAVRVWSFAVVDGATALPRFLTASSEFPRFLQAGRDTLAVTLRLGEESGAPPFAYTLMLEDEGRVVWEARTAERAIPTTWAPAAADTGTRHVVASVVDVAGDTDELHRDIEVVPPNMHPCSLVVSHSAGIDTTADGAIDMWHAGTNDTVSLHVLDDDHPLTERHEVSITTGGMTDVRVPDSDGILQLVIRPSKRTDTASYDTIRVRVSDMTGTSYETVIVVWHGKNLPDLTSAELRFAGDGSVRCVTRTDIDGTPAVSEWGSTESMFHFWPAPTGMPQPSHTIEGPFPTLHFDRDEATSLVADAVQGVWEWLDNAFTLVLVVRLDTVEPNTNYAAISAGATDSTFIAFGVVDAEAGMFTSGNSARCGITVGAGSWHIYCFQSRTGLRGSASLSADSWVDGSAGNALHVAERLHSSSIVAGLEHHEGGRNGWQGDIAELLMFDGALSDGDRRRVEQYLSDKYEIELR